MKLSKTIQLFSLVSILFVAGCKKDAKNDPGPTPTVSTTTPANNATAVARNNSITIAFSAAMDPATINSSTVIVKKGDTVIPGTVTYTGTTATFTPTDPFLALTEYTVTVTTGAKTLAGTPIAANVVSSFTTGGSTSVLAVVNLGDAITYTILAKTKISNVPTSNINGNLGLSPAATSYITGFPLTAATGYATTPEVNGGGKLYASDMAVPTPGNLTTAVENMITAYTDAAGRPLPDFVALGTGNIGGKTLSPGLYKWTNTVTAPTSFTISGGSNDVWIFQIAENLTVSSAVNVTLAGGAQAKNIFWQVAGTVTLGTTSHFEGIILSMTGITLQTGASLHGQALAQTAVILDNNVVTKPQ